VKAANKTHYQIPITDQQRNATKRRQRTNRMFVAMVIAFSLRYSFLFKSICLKTG
jgi:hypothetical protein